MLLQNHITIQCHLFHMVTVDDVASGLKCKTYTVETDVRVVMELYQENLEVVKVKKNT